MSTENKKGNKKNLDDNDIYIKFNTYIKASECFSVFFEDIVANNVGEPHKNLYQPVKLYQCCKSRRKGNYDNYDSNKLRDYAKAQDT